MRGRSEELNELATALSAAQAEFTAVPKDSQNPFFKNTYASLKSVVEAASPVITKHGLSIAQFVGYDEHGQDTLTTWLLHKSGQFIAEEMRLHITPDSKNPSQAQGSATSYARRYAYQAALGLVADEDDDAQKAVGDQRKAATSNSVRNPEALSPDPFANGEPTPSGELVAPSDIAHLRQIAAGLSKEQIQMTLTSCGIPITERGWSGIPQAKAAMLAEALAAVQR